MLWASFNVMVGPALSLKLWVPGLTWRQFMGVVGATFGALLIMVTMQTTLQTLFFPGAEPGLQNTNTSENILAIGLIELPTLLWTGYVLGYFLAQALRGWFPDGGGAGYVRRMSLIWMGTGALMVFITFPFIMFSSAFAQERLGGREVFGRVDVEERIDALPIEIDRRKEDLGRAVVFNPGAGLAFAALQRSLEFVRERDGPQPHDRVRARRRPRHEKRRCGLCLRQEPLHEIGGEEGRISRDRHHVGRV
jgi:hypothetical protein